MNTFTPVNAKFRPWRSMNNKHGTWTAICTYYGTLNVGQSSLLVALGQRVGLRVVEQGVVPVAPRKRLGPDAEVGVGVELWLPVFLDVVVVLVLFLPAVVGGDQAERDGPEQRDVAPRVGEAHGVVLLCLYVPYVRARRTSPRSVDTSHTNSSKRRHFLDQSCLSSKCVRILSTASIIMEAHGNTNAHAHNWTPY